MSHILDDDTAILWRFDEEANNDSNYTTVADASGNGYDATQSTGANRPSIGGGPSQNGIQKARVFNRSGSNDHFMTIPTIDSTLRNTYLADFTFACWVYLEESSPGANRFAWMCYTPGSDTEANNILFGLFINTSGRLAVTWEHDSGTDVSLANTAHTLSSHQWYHVAVTCDRGTTETTITFYVDGDEGDTGALTNATGGSTTTQYLGGSGSGVEFSGRIGDLHLSNILRSGSEILADAQSSDKAHTADANTVILYPFNEAPTVSDISINGIDLAHVSFTAVSEPVSPLIAGGGYARIFDGSGGLFAVKRQSLIDVLQGEWTLECWLQLRDDTTTTVMTIFDYTGSTGSELQANNRQLRLTINASDQVEVRWEHSAGTDVSGVSTGTFWDSSEQSRHHLGIVKRSVGGDSFDVDYYKDGVFVETIISGGEGNDGGTDEGCLLHIAKEINSGTELEGRIDDLRLSSVARSADDIATSYNDGAIGTASTDVYRLYRASQAEADPNIYYFWTTENEEDAAGTNYPGPGSVNLSSITIEHKWTN